MNTWWIHTKTFKRELAALFLLVIVIGLSVFYLFNGLVPTVLSSQAGLLNVAGVIVNVLFGVSRDAVIVIPIGMVLGLTALLSLDAYKYMYAYLLLGGAVLAFFVIVQQGSVIAPTKWQWIENIPFLLFGVLLGFVYGGITWEGRYPTRPSTFGHDLMWQHREPGTNYEFTRALPRLLWLVGIGLVYMLFEHIVQYSLLPPKFINLHLSGIGLDVLAVAVLLVVLAAAGKYTKDTSTILIGPTGSGKTTTMAGMSLTATTYADEVTADGPLMTLRDIFRNGGFDAIDSTGTNVALPARFTYKHGVLFPKKVTVTTVDYAGDHIRSLRVPEEPADVDTRSFTEAFEVARYLRWDIDQRVRERGEEHEKPIFIESVEQVGIDPTAESTEIDWSDRVYDLSRGEFSQSMLVRKVIEDMLYYADSIVLLVPMDDFASYAIDNGNPPDWLRKLVTTGPDEYITDDNELDFNRERGEYLSTYQNIYEELCKGGGRDLLYLFTQADVAIKDYVEETDRNPAQPLMTEPDAFVRHIATNFVPEGDDRGKLCGLYANPDSDEITEDRAFAVNFDVEPSTSDTDTPVQLKDGDTTLYGTQQLLERFGRT